MFRLELNVDKGSYMIRTSSIALKVWDKSNYRYFYNNKNSTSYTNYLIIISLQIKDIQGNSLTCTRSMKTTMKKKKLIFESLDATG
jgi:hypothetical protein